MIGKAIYQVNMLIRKGYNKLLIVPGLKQSLGGCGKKVRIAYDCDFKANSNIFIGDYSQIGPHALFWTTRAKIRIGNYVLLGPSVTIITGNHRTDVIGRHIAEVREEEKLPDNDGDIVVKDGAWIGANVTILKGVTIGEGCVIAAGSVVTKSTDEYSVYAGVPAKKIKERFTAEELQKHKEMIANRLKE